MIRGYYLSPNGGSTPPVQLCLYKLCQFSNADYHAEANRNQTEKFESPNFDELIKSLVRAKKSRDNTTGKRMNKKEKRRMCNGIRKAPIGWFGKEPEKQKRKLRTK